ncbi:MAG: response regulator transcription factor [Proteobacteria bacterium]|nr:response regulator transcription factor [Pseudomonadota bacterium]
MKILIAEDDFTSRTVLMEVLKKHDHEVVATVNGAEAWAAMQQPDAPRLAILDWMMPEMDGIEVCRHIRTLETDEPPYIIMLTTKGEKSDIIVGLETGGNDYLAKPFDPEELRARVNVGRRMIEMQAKLAGRMLELQKALWEQEKLTLELRDALSQVKILSGLLPICASCKKIRNDEGYWEQMEMYIRDHSEAEFSHSICPECAEKLYPEFYKKK